MQVTRRQALGLSAGAAALVIAGPVAAPAFAKPDASADEAVKAFTGGAEAKSGKIALKTPEIAENGNTVPISVSAEGASAILILAAGNPTPGVAQFKFGELAGSQTASTRMRLAGTQDVIAIAQMADGSFAKASKTVKVTIGGCGG